MAKKINQRIAQRSRLARIDRQTRDDDERDELEEVVPGAIRPSTSITTIFHGRGTTPVREARPTI